MSDVRRTASPIGPFIWLAIGGLHSGTFRAWADRPSPDAEPLPPMIHLGDLRLATEAERIAMKLDKDLAAEFARAVESI